MSLNDYICGQKFSDYAAWRYGKGELPNDNLIIYCHSDDLESCFQQVSLNGDSRYILISHNGDRNITQDLVNKCPNNIYYWYAQNADALSPKLEGLPIGISNPEWGELGSVSQMQDVLSLDIQPERLVYFGGQLHTNPSERVGMWNHLACDKIPAKEKFIHATRISRREYLKEISKSIFVASPPGNGIDCHRTWETLYMGRIPIVKRSIAMSHFKNLPILFYDDPSEITVELLQRTMVKYHYFYNLNHIPELFMEFWKNKILKKYQEIRE